MKERNATTRGTAVAMKIIHRLVLCPYMVTREIILTNMYHTTVLATIKMVQVDFHALCKLPDLPLLPSHGVEFWLQFRWLPTKLETHAYTKLCKCTHQSFFSNML
jgi:hypothetical protein